MSKIRLTAGASTQSRANRPLPDGWDIAVVGRHGCSEDWLIMRNGQQQEFPIEVTWVFDQGGPVLGYTSRRNKWTKLIREMVHKAENDGMYGPGSVVSFLERQAAEKLVEIVGPYIHNYGGKHMVRWLANGSDACDCAVRLARAYTGRTHFISIGYHGSSVIFAHRPQNAGIPKNIMAQRTDIEFGDSQTLATEMRAHRQACIIVEVPSRDPQDEEVQAFLRYCRDLCYSFRAMLIFDEVVTGFRLALGGAAELYGVKPDIACYGKAMSNGRGISAVVSVPRIMRLLKDKVFYSNTYNGDPYNCAHVLGTLITLQEQELEIYSHINDIGETLRAGLNSLGLNCIGYGARTAIMPRDEHWLGICAQLVKKGIVMDRPQYASMSHGKKEIDMTLDAIEEIQNEHV